jgi:hypothetical protein
VPSGKCLDFGGYVNQGYGSCPGAPPGYQISALLAGPIPDNGARVSYLHAETNINAVGNWQVEVIDNGNLKTACTVVSGTKSCTAGLGGNAVAGDNLEVRVTRVSTFGGNQRWRVSFRY